MSTASTADLVATLGRLQADAGQFEESAVGDLAGVDAEQHRLGVGSPEVGGDELGERGGTAPAVAGPQGEAEGPDPEPGATRSEVARQLGQAREPLDGAVRPEPDAVEPGAADDGHPPTRLGPGPEHGHGVVAHEIGAGPSPGPHGVAESFRSSTSKSTPAMQ